MIAQQSATSPLFFDNLHFEHFDKSVNHKIHLEMFVEMFEMEIVEKRGLVADCCDSMMMCLYNSQPKSLPLPNEDFGRPNKHFRTRFRSTFQRFVAQI